MDRNEHWCDKRSWLHGPIGKRGWATHKRAMPDRTYNGRPCQNGTGDESFFDFSPAFSQVVQVGANAQRRREQVVQDVLKSNESVKFYTGILSLSCFMLLVNILFPYAEKMKYWDKNKDQKSYYHDDPEKEKPGRKRKLELKEEFTLILLRLKLGLMERHLADMFAVSVSTVSRIYITWVRFLALTFKGSILRWPSRGN